MGRYFALFSFAVLAACQPEADSACVQEVATYSVTAQVSLSLQASQGSASKTVGAAEPRVLASVSQSSSVTACSGGLVSVATPGAPLVTARPVFVDAAGFTLRFSETLYPELEPPTLHLEVLLDENGNGRCDDGEPSGGVALSRVPHAHLQLELASAPCRFQL